MNKLLKTLAYSGFISAMLFSHANAATTTPLTGVWEETIISDDYDSDDKDQYYISNYGDQILINSVNYPDYAIGQVKQEGKKLTFTMVNLVDPDETYILNYTCNETVRAKEMKCKFVNQKDESEDNIIWKKK